MLRLANAYIDKAVLSLRTGGKIGITNSVIINPNNLKLEGWYVESLFEKGSFILPIAEVRDFISKGIVVDDHDALTLPEDMIRLKEVIELRFELIGKAVITESKKKLGKVDDYAVDDLTSLIQKMYVNPPMLKGFTSDQLLISRQDIVEINDKKIIVRDALVHSRVGVPVTAQA